MPGRGYAVFEVAGNSSPFAGFASHSGGETNPVMRDVPSATRPATMISEPSGGLEFVALELTFSDKVSDGFLIDDALLYFQTWQLSPEAAGERREVAINWYNDPDLNTDSTIARHELTGAYPSAITFPEGERESDAPREFTVTLVHKGSSYIKTGA
jgi:hypothetical protein